MAPTVTSIARRITVATLCAGLAAVALAGCAPSSPQDVAKAKIADVAAAYGNADESALDDMLCKGVKQEYPFFGTGWKSPVKVNTPASVEKLTSSINGRQMKNGHNFSYLFIDRPNAVFYGATITFPDYGQTTDVIIDARNGGCLAEAPVLHPAHNG